jgi:hypothetical protein
VFYKVKQLSKRHVSPRLEGKMIHQKVMSVILEFLEKAMIKSNLKILYLQENTQIHESKE